MKNMNKRLEIINAATKLWQGLEGQKQWNQNIPSVVKIIDASINQLRLEIILMCQPDKMLNVLNINLD